MRKRNIAAATGMLHTCFFGLLAYCVSPVATLIRPLQILPPVAYTLVRWASKARPAIWRDVMDVSEEGKCGSQTLELDNLARQWLAVIQVEDDNDVEIQILVTNLGAFG